MGKVSENILKVGFRSFKDLLTLQIWRLRQRLKSAWFQVGDLLAILHCLSQTSDSKATHGFTLTSAVMGMLTSVMFPEVASNVISRIWRLLIFILCKNRIHPCHSSWQPLLGSSLCQCCAEHLSLMDLACFGLMRALFRGWILSIGWHGRLRIRRLWFPSRLQGWICARASMFILNWYIGALQCCVRFRCGSSLVAQRVKNLLAVPETWVQSLGQEDALDKEIAFHSSILS